MTDTQRKLTERYREAGWSDPTVDQTADGYNAKAVAPDGDVKIFGTHAPDGGGQGYSIARRRGSAADGATPAEQDWQFSEPFRHPGLRPPTPEQAYDKAETNWKAKA